VGSLKEVEVVEEEEEATTMTRMVIDTHNLSSPMVKAKQQHRHQHQHKLPRRKKQLQREARIPMLLTEVIRTTLRCGMQQWLNNSNKVKVKAKDQVSSDRPAPYDPSCCLTVSDDDLDRILQFLDVVTLESSIHDLCLDAIFSICMTLLSMH
jgi:hypothetical protein